MAESAPGAREHGWWRAVFPAEDVEIYDLYRPPLERSLDPAAAVLLVVDATEEFLGARLDTVEAAREIPTACGRVAWDAVERIAELVDAFRERGMPVVFTVPDWGLQHAVGAATAGVERSFDSSFGSMPKPLTPRANEPVVSRSKPSAFFGSPLTGMLIRWNRREVVVVGGTTSGCVRATVVDGSSYGFDVTLVEDACFDRSKLSHAVTLFELERKYATIRGTDSFLAELT